MDKPTHFLGLGKTKFNSSVCLIPNSDLKQTQIWQTERLTRKKDSGSWPSAALLAMEKFALSRNIDNFHIAENRDVETPAFFEEFFNNNFPFYDYLEQNSLKKYSTKFNPQIEFVTHHEAHAQAALAMSPFEKSIIVVMDGAGNRAQEFASPLRIGAEDEDVEVCSVYLQRGANIELHSKIWAKFLRSKKWPDHIVSQGAGFFYEKASEFIFNSSTSAGKVMGLAPFGSAKIVKDKIAFLEELGWQNRFIGENKKLWEESIHFPFYCDLAATVQAELERDYFSLINKVKQKFPDYDNLILTGGCALNCTNNAKILYSKLFNKMYVLPFPGDESISLGLAGKNLFEKKETKWAPTSFDQQHAYWGPVLSVPNEDKLVELLRLKKIPYKLSSDLVSDAAIDLLNNKVIGWFQGRSESGPRALGNRSILVRPDVPGIKDHLNSKIKFREKFRPYGCSVIHEKGQEYFEIDEGFDNPFMSYALRVRPTYKELLKEVSHVDGTSRMQTVRKTQNALFYSLILEFGKRSGLYCLLNTSLNVMGEPIVESMEDAVSFFEKVNVDSMYIGNIKLYR